MDQSVSSDDPVRDVFVFGSDLAGRHTSGNALMALRRHGAVYGRSVGLQGRSYAIPVRDEQGKLMPATAIARYVSAFLRFAAIHREMTFHVSRIGCERGGYRDDEIAPLFAGAPRNCRLPKGWERFIERRAAANPLGESTTHKEATVRALILSTNGFEDAELLVPYYRLEEEGMAVDVVAPVRGTIRGKHGYEVEATRAAAEVQPDEYDLLIIPGGRAAEALSDDPAALRIAQWFLEQHKPIAAICHGPLVLAATGLLEGRHATCHPSIAAALGAARVRYLDQNVVVDDDLVTSRRPADLPAFMREVTKIVHRLRRAQDK
jgi:protease I